MSSLTNHHHIDKSKIQQGVSTYIQVRLQNWYSFYTYHSIAACKLHSYQINENNDIIMLSIETNAADLVYKAYKIMSITCDVVN